MGSSDRICRSSVGVKAWQSAMPTVSAVRPARCSGCGAASCPAGRNLVVHGDGTRERQLWGPDAAEGPPRMTTVQARRYQCQRCGTCMLVVPAEVLRRRLYSAPAIGLALALWALLGQTAARVRARVSPLAVIGPAAAGRWTTLRRWARATSGGRLFATGRAPPENFTLRQHAERAAALLRALAPTDLPLADAVFAGAALHRPV
jgi:ferredoxin